MTLSHDISSPQSAENQREKISSFTEYTKILKTLSRRHKFKLKLRPKALKETDTIFLSFQAKPPLKKANYNHKLIKASRKIGLNPTDLEKQEGFFCVDTLFI